MESRHRAAFFVLLYYYQDILVSFIKFVSIETGMCFQQKCETFS
jgi:hypothetical protein